MKLLNIVILSYILFIAALFVMQRTLIYYPDTSKPPVVEGAQVIKVTTSDAQNLEAWYFPPKSADKNVIVFFHGNAGNYGHRFYKVQNYINAGYGMLLAEYRGYGGNLGKPSEQGFFNDGRAYMDWLLSFKGTPPKQVVIYGESIGSGTAVKMASEYNIGALILEVPFSSLLEVAARKYFIVPVKYLLKDKFMNIDMIADVNVPLLIMHGDMDTTIPISSAKKLFDAAMHPKEFISFPQGNHNNLYDFGASAYVLDFLAGINTL